MPLVANLAALIMEIGAAVLLATLFAVVRRQVKPRAYFELWERAWAVLALSLVLLLARHIPGVPSLLGLLGYQWGSSCSSASCCLARWPTSVPIGRSRCVPRRR